MRAWWPEFISPTCRHWTLSLTWNGERQTDNTRKLCKRWVGRGALCQHLPLRELVRQGMYETACVYFVLCTDFFAPRLNSRFSFSFITFSFIAFITDFIQGTSWDQPRCWHQRRPRCPQPYHDSRSEAAAGAAHFSSYLLILPGPSAHLPIVL